MFTLHALVPADNTESARQFALECGVIQPEEKGSIMDAEEFNRLIRNEEGKVGAVGNLPGNTRTLPRFRKRSSTSSGPVFEFWLVLITWTSILSSRGS